MSSPQTVDRKCASIYGLYRFETSTGLDPASESRIAAQIVTGIGFLGAGLIIKDGATVRNLTTAASIWFAGSIGMAIGFGFYQIAIIAAIASVFIPRIPHVGPNRRKFQAEKVVDETPIESPTVD